MVCQSRGRDRNTATVDLTTFFIGNIFGTECKCSFGFQFLAVSQVTFGGNGQISICLGDTVVFFRTVIGDVMICGDSQIITCCQFPIQLNIFRCDSFILPSRDGSLGIMNQIR